MSRDMIRAAAIDRFGEPEQLSLRVFPLPTPGPGQVRIYIAAGIVNLSKIVEFIEEKQTPKWG